MSYSAVGSDRSLVRPEEDIRVLGQTGQTVVYLFPDGRALPEREQPDFEALEQQNNPPAKANESLLDELIAAGKMTAAQKTVVLHDQEMTGMELEEILTARGWR
jgi:hypothetical protein